VIKAAIFDIDGTLIDSVDLHARAWQEALHQFGHDVPFDMVRHQIGKGGDQLLPVFLTRSEQEQYGKDLEKYRAKLWKQNYMHRVRPFPGVRPLFQRLKEDEVRIALASSAKGDELEFYKRVAGIDDLVDKTTSSDDAEHSKPHPDIFEAALSKLGESSPSGAAAIGDSPYDAEAARSLELPCIGVRSGGFAEQELLASGCSAIYNDCSDLLQHYQQWVQAALRAA
jgi:HAD superfamily hydrolase (TIGR01509 family)